MLGTKYESNICPPLALPKCLQKKLLILSVAITGVISTIYSPAPPSSLLTHLNNLR